MPTPEAITEVNTIINLIDRFTRELGASDDWFRTARRQMAEFDRAERERERIARAAEAKAKAEYVAAMNAVSDLRIEFNEERKRWEALEAKVSETDQLVKAGWQFDRIRKVAFTRDENLAQAAMESK